MQPASDVSVSCIGIHKQFLGDVDVVTNTGIPQIDPDPSLGVAEDIKGYKLRGIGEDIPQLEDPPTHETGWSLHAEYHRKR